MEQHHTHAVISGSERALSSLQPMNHLEEIIGPLVQLRVPHALPSEVSSQYSTQLLQPLLLGLVGARLCGDAREHRNRR